jgi:hypothetical protein
MAVRRGALEEIPCKFLFCLRRCRLGAPKPPSPQNLPRRQEYSAQDRGAGGGREAGAVAERQRPSVARQTTGSPVPVPCAADAAPLPSTDQAAVAKVFDLAPIRACYFWW